MIDKAVLGPTTPFKLQWESREDRESSYQSGVAAKLV